MNNPDAANAPLQAEGALDAQLPTLGTGLSLSGGGYRAMLFHVGSLWRFHQAGHLHKVQRRPRVAGGSITREVLALAWKRLPFDGKRAAFETLVADPVRALAGRTLDAEAIIGGIFLPGSIGNKVAAAYDKHLFHGATLQDLPDNPRFVINATNVQSGALWRFSKP